MFNAKTERKATRTSLRGIGWMHIENLDSLSSGFILNKHLQLVKGPSVEPRADFFARFNAISDIFQIFKKNRRTSILLCFGDDFFRHAVVHMASRTLFSAGDLSQSLFCRLRTFALKALSKIGR